MTHQHARVGVFTPTVTATNAAGQAAAVSAGGIVVKAVTGNWTVTLIPLGDPFPFSLTQNGSSVSGTGVYASTTTVVTGTVLDRRSMNLSVTVQAGPGGQTNPWTFPVTATGDATGDAFTATATGPQICPCTGALVRQ